MFTYTTSCQRNSFRLCPSENEPIVIRFKGKNVSLIEISAGGTSFNNPDCRIGDSEKIQFTLPGQDTPISATIEILRVDELNICRCMFKDIDEESSESIHRYVLKMQKKYLSDKRKKRMQRKQK